MSGSNHRPLIGVPPQTLQVIDGIPKDMPSSWVMNRRYLDVLASLGAAPIIVPLFEDEAMLRGLYDRLDGLFLAGGVDVDPSRYGEERSPLCGPTDPARDRVELLMTKWALDDGKPLLGVCRGVEVLNVAAGGTLYQDIAAQHRGAIKHDYFPTAGFARDYLAHDVRLLEATKLRAIFGSDAVTVNSMHHQGIRDLAAGLVASAVSPDGLIEAAEKPGDAFQVAVVWHPEMFAETHPPSRRLFEEFIKAAGGA